MQKEIARVNRVVITLETTRDAEHKFALHYVLEREDKQGVLAIQRLLSETTLRELAAAFQEAVEYLDRS